MGAMGATELCLWTTLFAGMTPWTGKEQDVTWREEEGGKIRVVGARVRVRVVSCRVLSCSVVSRDRGQGNVGVVGCRGCPLFLLPLYLTHTSTVTLSGDNGMVVTGE